MKISVRGVEYYVEISGKGSPVLLLHGFTGDVTTWKNVIRDVTANHRVIAIDIIGHGKTASPDDVKRYDICQVAKDISLILDELCVNEIHVLGYSMGGRLALSFAILFPERVKGLILESASPGLKTKEERKARKQKDGILANRILENGMKDFVEYWEQIPLFTTQLQLPSKIREEIRSQRLSNSPQGLANSLWGMGTGEQPSWWEDLYKIKFPVLLICGERDEKFCNIARQMQTLLSNAELSIVGEAGHAVHVEEPKKFGTIVEEFLHKGGNRYG